MAKLFRAKLFFVQQENYLIEITLENTFPQKAERGYPCQVDSNLELYCPKLFCHIIILYK